MDGDRQFCVKSPKNSKKQVYRRLHMYYILEGLVHHKGYDTSHDGMSCFKFKKLKNNLGKEEGKGWGRWMLYDVEAWC